MAHFDAFVCCEFKNVQVIFIYIFTIYLRI